MNESLHPVVKRGRKPIGDAPMTAAERKRASRAKKAAAGRAELMISLGGGMLDFIDRMALAGASSRAQVIYELLDMAISRTAAAVAQAEQMWADGASDQEVQAFMSESLRSAPPLHLVKQYKGVLGIE